MLANLKFKEGATCLSKKMQPFILLCAGIAYTMKNDPIDTLVCMLGRWIEMGRGFLRAEELDVWCVLFAEGEMDNAQVWYAGDGGKEI